MRLPCVEGQVEWLLANPWKIVPAPRKVKREFPVGMCDSGFSHVVR
jgi:hypothetical protein